MIQVLAKKWYQAVELIVLFVLMPLLYWSDKILVHKLLPLTLIFLYCIGLLILEKRISRIQWTVKANWKLLFFRFALVCAVVVAFILAYTSNTLLADFDRHQQLPLLILIYPLFSAFPQEVIFREFFFYRYKQLFTNQKILVAVNVLLFSFTHIYFENWVVLASTLLVGTVFALTYLKTHSLLVVTLEHSLYGLMILSSGMAEYFYKPF